MRCGFDDIGTRGTKVIWAMMVCMAWGVLGIYHRRYHIVSF